MCILCTVVSVDRGRISLQLLLLSVSGDAKRRKWGMMLFLLHPVAYRTVSELSQLIVQILDTLRFWARLWCLSSSVHLGVHLGLIGKRVVDFLLVLIKLFSLGVTLQLMRYERK